MGLCVFVCNLRKRSNICSMNYTIVQNFAVRYLRHQKTSLSSFNLFLNAVLEFLIDLHVLVLLSLLSLFTLLAQNAFNEGNKVLTGFNFFLSHSFNSSCCFCRGCCLCLSVPNSFICFLDAFKFKTALFKNLFLALMDEIAHI